MGIANILPSIAEQPERYTPQQQFILGQLFMLLAKERMPTESIHPINGLVATITTVATPNKFQDILYKPNMDIHGDILTYVTEDTNDKRATQPAFRGTSSAHRFPEFSGNALIKFHPMSTFGIHVPTLLDQYIQNPTKYYPDLKEIFKHPAFRAFND